MQQKNFGKEARKSLEHCNTLILFSPHILSHYGNLKIFLQGKKCKWIYTLQDFLAKQQMHMNVYPEKHEWDILAIYFCVVWVGKIQDIQLVKFFIVLLFQLHYWWSPSDSCVFSGLWKIVDQAKMFSEGPGAGNAGGFKVAFVSVFPIVTFFASMLHGVY